MQFMNLSFVSIFLRSANELFPTDGAKRSFPLMHPLDMHQQVGALTVSPLAHGTRMAHAFVHALDVRRQHFARVVDLVAEDALQLPFDVFDQAVIAQPVSPVEHTPTLIALELLARRMTFADVRLHFRRRYEAPANFARAFLHVGAVGFGVGDTGVGACSV